VKKTPSDNESFEFGPPEPNTSLEVHLRSQRQGEIVIASASGSQIPAYAYSSNNVIWVVGAQKIVASLGDGLRRVREYCLPIESAKMRNLGYTGSAIGKLLIFERERASQRSLTLILVNEKLGV